MEHEIRDTPHELPDQPPQPAAAPKRSLSWAVPALVLAAFAAAYFYWPRPESPQVAVAPPPAAVPAKPEAQVEPAIKHPIEEARPEGAEPSAAAAVLPSLDESDPAVDGALASLAGGSALDQFVQRTGVIRRIVATVDNLPRQRAPVRAWPIKPVGGAFVTLRAGDGVYLDPRNYRRYEPFVRFAESIDTGRAVALYVRFYPLLQQAYRELGYPEGHFNDRLVEVVDHLLATPEVQGPTRLAQPFVLWTFADPALEARSAGQKTLVRIGPENAQRLKAKLRDVRRQVTRQAAVQ
jgi:hypothetical protein